MRLLLVASLLLSLTATAQVYKSSVGPKILVFGVDTVKDCSPQIAALQEELVTLHFPDDWKIGVACSSIGWNSLRKIGDFQKSDSAFTNIRKRSTVVNSEIFNHFRSSYRHVLAHELGHIACDCADEDKAERLAYKLEK